MIEAGLEFIDNIDLVLEKLVRLPGLLRPTYFSHEERVENEFDRVDDQNRFQSFLKSSKSGFFLTGAGVTYSIRIISEKSLICDCFLNVEPQLAIAFLKHMSEASPCFGFACDPSEREWRNRLVILQGENETKAWVGRDTHKYLPGLYWLTLISDDLAKKHGISYPKLSASACEYSELVGGQHLFRFYETPADWRDNYAVAKLYESTPSLFKIDSIRSEAESAVNFLELHSVLRNWR
jgi:hypothetical protein